MKVILCLFLIYSVYSSYSRAGALNYAKTNVHNPNHECDSYYESCTPYAYYGSEHCGYTSHGGNSANFVSQCLVKGGNHPKLTGSRYCTGYPCGFEEVGVWALGTCLVQKGWKSECGYLMKPPSYIKAGDVIIYHKKGCDGDGHAALITVEGDNPKITCQSIEQINQDYKYQSNSYPYYEWLHYQQ